MVTRADELVNTDEQSVALRRTVDTGDVRLGWGGAATLKASWREDSLNKHLDLPVAERLRAALALVLPRSDNDRRTR